MSMREVGIRHPVTSVFDLPQIAMGQAILVTASPDHNALLSTTSD